MGRELKSHRRRQPKNARCQSGPGFAQLAAEEARNEPRDPCSRIWRTRSSQMGEGRGRSARSRRGQDQADGDRPQLYRRLHAHGSLPAKLAAVRAGNGRCRRRHRSRRRGEGPEGGASRRLCRTERRLRRGAADRRRSRGEDSRKYHRPDRRRHHAQGHDGAISRCAAPTRSGRRPRFCFMPPPAASASSPASGPLRSAQP